MAISYFYFMIKARSVLKAFQVSPQLSILFKLISLEAVGCNDSKRVFYQTESTCLKWTQ